MSTASATHAGRTDWKAYFDLARPFTLVAPALGFISGALTAVGAAPPEPWSAGLLVAPLVGSLMAAVLNAGNNALNQIYDLEIDRVNKPKRPLTSGRLSVAQAWGFSAVAYLLALVLAWLVAPGGRHECFWLVAAAVVFTLLYSIPPFRTKRRGIWANITIAIPRGVLLKVAGWSSVKTIAGSEPWYIGAIFGLFLLGATTTKDFADMEGDRLGGCRTLPIQYGVRRAAWMISPSFVVPFLMIPIGAWLHVLTGDFRLLQTLGAVMTAYGVYVCYLMLRRPEDLAVEENHVSWAHMYRMMFVAQIGFALAYLL
jgi:4-hydroxybenzoate polyprenyltransferase